MLSLDNGDYILEIEEGKTSERWGWAGGVGDDGGKIWMFVNCNGEGCIDGLFEGGNGREGLEDVVTGYTDVVIDVEVIPCCKGLLETSLLRY